MYNAQMGDIILIDSNKLPARIIKFLMQAPTVWQWMWRAIRSEQEPVNYYHAGMIFDNNVLVEQEGKFQYGDTQKRLAQRVIIYRMKNLSQADMTLLQTRALAQLGQGYGIAEVIGHTITWLTGIKWFLIVLGSLTRNSAICINRVCRLYNHIENFGSWNWYEDTTKTVDEYCAKSPNWEVVYKNG